jgi:serine/threonine protein kinase
MTDDSQKTGPHKPQEAHSNEAGLEQWPAVPGYQILQVLGRGGMGVVYKARQTKLQRQVALKMILAGDHAGAADLARFRTEAEAIARLQHPNIVQIFEVGEHDGKPFFSLEFCGQGSLADRLNGTPLPPKGAARLVETLARAMDFAHRQGVIHRDLKPANVLLQKSFTAKSGGTTEQGNDTVGSSEASAFYATKWIPKITDFGLAKKLDDVGQTQSGAIMGTPSYMAPEQAAGKTKSLGPAADVYALGAILYECLTGRW